MSSNLYIIDGHAQIYSAYFAPMSGALTAPSGEPTKATLIFTTMMLKLLKLRRPDMLVVTMDSPGPTFRHKMYDQYKANRPPMPEDLPVQIERIDQILTSMRIPIFRIPGFEADDLIGTLAAKARTESLNVYICSKDKDLEQLLADGVTMYDPKIDAELDVAGLLEKKGITPEQVPDILALQGDTSDNIPGVPDVGPKTAIQWIQKYGNLAELVAHKDEIKGKRGNNLQAAVDQLQLSRDLATINCDVPMEIDWEAMAVDRFDKPALAELFDQLGFRRLLAQLDEIGGSIGDVSQAEGRSTDSSGNGGVSSGGSAGNGGGGDSVGIANSGGSAISGESTAKPWAAQSNPAEYVLVDTAEGLSKLCKELEKQEIIALDTETTAINPVAAELVGLSFSWQTGLAYYVPVKAPLGQQHVDRDDVLKQLKPILADPRIKKVGQNIKYDMIVLLRAGVELAGVAFDTMVASYVLDSNRAHHSMDSMAADYLGHETIKIDTLLGKGKNQLTFDMVDLATAADYAAEDAEVTWRLYQYLDAHMTDEQLRRLFEQVEMPVVEVLCQMEFNGVALDVGWLKKMSSKLSDRLEELVAEIHKEAGGEFNVDSPKQLANVLFDKLLLTSVKKTKGGSSGTRSRSTDQEVLETLRWQHPVPALMLEYRKLAKLKNTYIDKLPTMICSSTKRVHASFNQTVTATGRLSSSDPNMQNIPIRSEQGQEIRRAFVPASPDSVILAADYSQIELRFMAHFSRDPALIEAFESGQDIHRFVAAQVYDVPLDEVDSEQRSRAKAVNFGIMYGQTAFGLSRGIGIQVNEAQEFIDDYFARYASVKQFVDEVIAGARKEGIVRTILGRRRGIADLHSQNYNRRRLAERMAVNTVVQGSAADMIKLAMINLHKRIKQEKLDMQMIMQVHDELVFELPQDKAKAYSTIITEEMAGAMKLNVPVTVDVGYGRNWLECK